MASKLKRYERHVIFWNERDQAWCIEMPSGFIPGKRFRTQKDARRYIQMRASGK